MKVIQDSKFQLIYQAGYLSQLADVTDIDSKQSTTQDVKININKLILITKSKT